MRHIRSSVLGLLVPCVMSQAAIASGDTERDWMRAALVSESSDYESLRIKGDWVSFDPTVMIQFRYIADIQDQRDGQDELTAGFVNSRTRLGFKAKLEDHDVDFFVWSGFTGSGTSLLLDAWSNWKVDDNLSIKVGQFKVPVWQEWVVSETKQTFVERSILDARFSPLYGQGISGTWRDDSVSLTAVYSDGLRSWNQYDKGDQWALTGRAEVLFQGDWAQRADFNSFPDEEQFTVLGLAAHVQDGGTLGGDGGTNIYINDTKFTQLTADLQWGIGGTSFYAAFISNSEDRPGMIEYDQYGVLLQAQTFITDDIEIFARYEWGDLDGQAAAFAAANPGATMEEKLKVLTFGATKFLAGHALKVTGDVGVGFSEVSAAWGGTGRGWSGDDQGADTQVVLRAQVQVIF